VITSTRFRLRRQPLVVDAAHIRPRLGKAGRGTELFDAQSLGQLAMDDALVVLVAGSEVRSAAVLRLLADPEHALTRATV